MPIAKNIINKQIRLSRMYRAENKDLYPVASRATGFKNQVAHSNFQVSVNSQVHAMDHYGVRRVLPGETVI